MEDLEKVKREMIFRHMAKSSMNIYLYWIQKFREYHSGRPPEDMGTLEVKNYLEHLALSNKVVASTQNQAFSPLLFLYPEVLGLELTGLDNTLRAKDSIHVPVVLTHVAQRLGRTHHATTEIRDSREKSRKRTHDTS